MNLSETCSDGWDLIEELGIDFIRMPLSLLDSLDADQMNEFVGRVHEMGSELIVAPIEQPQNIARVWNSGVDFIQGDFVQVPSREPSFDFGESVLT
jgi:EAL domain-containing protein (putative c-di-GMP-specific phosphodiesterase class I)